MKYDAGLLINPATEVDTIPDAPTAVQRLFPYATDIICVDAFVNELVCAIHVEPLVEVHIWPPLAPAIHRRLP